MKEEYGKKLRRSSRGKREMDRATWLSVVRPTQSGNVLGGRRRIVETN
jgi:hypothetical protein